MTDYISREEANYALRECVRAYPNSFYNGIEAARSAIIKLPAADVRPVVRGHWIGVDDFPHEDWECDCCGEQVFGNDRIPKEFHFCPNCGADMRGENDV